VAFARLLVVRTQGSGEFDVGDVQADDRTRSDFVRRSGLLAYGSPGERGSLRMKCAGASVAGVFSAFREQVGWVLVRLGVVSQINSLDTGLMLPVYATGERSGQREYCGK